MQNLDQPTTQKIIKIFKKNLFLKTTSIYVILHSTIDMSPSDHPNIMQQCNLKILFIYVDKTISKIVGNEQHGRQEFKIIIKVKELIPR